MTKIGAKILSMNLTILIMVMGTFKVDSHIN
jgi:hypothetical protein